GHILIQGFRVRPQNDDHIEALENVLAEFLVSDFKGWNRTATIEPILENIATATPWANTTDRSDVETIADPVATFVDVINPPIAIIVDAIPNFGRPVPLGNIWPRVAAT